jgi:hypothetical protein
MELGSRQPHYLAVKWYVEATMSAQKEFENYAFECIKLAEHANAPELRDQLLAMAREWIEAADKEGERDVTPPSSSDSPHAHQ